MVRVVDTEAALPLVAAVYEALYGEPLPKGSRVNEQAVVVAWNKNAWGGAPDVAVIHTEGVGEWLSMQNTLALWVQIGMRDAMVPLGLNRIPLREEPVDFADHVRTFGDRLESNWSHWEGNIAKAQKEGVPNFYQHLVA
jgi:hypothetical protein